MKPDVVPEWLQVLLQDKAATFNHKVDALCTKGVAKLFLEEKRAKLMHPEMSNYTKVVLRVRAVNGFHEFHSLHNEVIEEIGRRGLAHEIYP